MGYHRHHAIVVTSWDDKSIEAAHEKARRCFAHTAVEVTPITSPGVNSYRSFLVAPDGSKEGWGESDSADDARAEFIAWLRRTKLYPDWALVEFGGDEKEMLSVEGPYTGARVWEDRDGTPRADALAPSHNPAPPRTEG